MAIDVKAEWAKRSWWLNAIMLFSIFMVFIYTPFDVIMKPLAEDEDVWFGYMFTGWAAKVGGAVHCIVYAAIAWGLWKMRPWVWWVGGLYLTQVSIAMFLWPLFQTDGGVISAVIAGTLFAIPAVAFWRAKEQFQGAA
ncbi:MAG: hypothetical protein EP301_04015 [Gammaproteobacteria bacterium]|jgi:hypothetical protein|nr:MAG: hypothetical protein EP301_04015 [Gammaproteobacteria bacterium]